MKHKNISKLILLLPACFVIVYGCRKENYNLPEQPVNSYDKIYMPQAVSAPALKTFKITDSVQTLTYGAYFGGQNYPANDIPVSFAVDNTKVDSFNLANKTAYAILPTGSYTLSDVNSVIPKGQLNTPPLSISLKTKGAGAMEALKTYLLPVSLSNKTAIPVNEGLRTTFFIVKAQPDFNDYPNYDRTSLQIIGFSSQEANGEGPNNGRAIFALDGNSGTYWHTQWQGGAPGPPHYLTVDMGAVKTLHGLSFLGRQADVGGKPNEVNVQVSMDNIMWGDAGTFTLQNNKNLQPQFLPNGFKTARYFKVIINSAYGGSYTQIAELNAF